MCDACDDNSGYLCIDCGVDTSIDGIQEYYMVTKAVWLKAGLKHPDMGRDSPGGQHDGMLCIGCLEARLGRKLKPADFTNVPINRGWFPMSERLTNRVYGLKGVRVP